MSIVAQLKMPRRKPTRTKQFIEVKTIKTEKGSELQSLGEPQVPRKEGLHARRRLRRVLLGGIFDTD
jgi:hypothetical protein